MSEDMKFEEWKAQNEVNLEHYRATCQYDLEHYRTTCQYDLEQLRIVNLAGQSALKANVFLNAGAAVSMLAFMANVFDSLDSNIAYKIIISICIFGIGTLLGSIATGFTYLSQYSFHDKKEKLGSILNNISNLMVQISYNLFVIGGYLTFIAMGAKFDLRVNTSWHWISGIILTTTNIAIGIVVYAVLKSKKETTEKAI